MTARWRQFLPPAAALLLACGPAGAPVSPPPRHFTDLSYAEAVARHRALMEKRYEDGDNSYLLSVLDYAATSLYAGSADSARRGFTAAYKIDDGKVPEAAKFYQWLQVDARTVYRLSKRERELVHLYLGLCYLFEDDPGEALVEFKKLRQRDQGASVLPAVNFYSGLVYEKLGQYDDALIEYRALEEMSWAGSSRFGSSARYPGATALVEHVRRLKEHAGPVPAGSDSLDLVVHVDHQFYPSTGRTEVFADGEPVGSLPPYVDDFRVALTEAEQTRAALQEASATATRTGLRCCGSILAEGLFGRGGADVADVAADIALGDERDDKDPRFWYYAPVAVSVARFVLPPGAREVELEFFDRDGARLGSCRYPLSGPEARAWHAAGSWFILAGLAPEFQVY